MGKAIKEEDIKKAEEVVEKKEAETTETEQKEDIKKAEEVKKADEYKIESPNQNYSGLTATVEFKNGIGTTKNKVIADYFKSRNYKVTNIK